MRGRRWGRNERGAALIEAAIILPVIMLLTFGAIELGIGFSQKGGLEAAARAGARKAATLTDVDTPPRHDDIGDIAVQAVNDALDSSAIPELVDMEVYRADQDPVTCASMCLKYVPDGTGKQFDPGSDGGAWPKTQRDACGSSPDRVGVRIHGRFHFLSGLVGSGSIDITATSILQLEPTNC